MNRDGTCTPGRELWKRKMFPHTGKSPHWWGINQDRGGTSKPWRRAQAPVYGGQRERDLHRWSVPSRRTSQPKTLIHWGGWGLGAEAWASEVRAGERTVVGCVKTAWQGRVRCATTEGVWEEAWAHQKGKVPLLWGAWGEGQDLHRSFFLCVYALRQQVTAYMSSGGGHELWLPCRTPEMGADCCCQQGSCEQVLVTAPTFPDACVAHQHCNQAPTTAPAPPRSVCGQLALPPRIPQLGTNCCPCLPGSVCGPCTWTPPIKRIMASTHWGKRR